MRVSLIMIAMLLCGVVLGYELGVFPIIAPTLRGAFNINFDSMSIITAILPLAAALSAIITGLFSDAFGRRGVVLIAAVLFVLGTLECAIGESIAEFIFGRIVIGLGVGMTAVILPLYLAEVAPAQKRGQWVVIYFLSVNVGIFLSCIIGFAFSFLEGWRSVFMIGAMPGLALFMFGMFLPESPRWLIMRGQNGQAGKALIKLFGFKKAMAIISAMDAIDHRRIYSKINLTSTAGLRIVLVGMLVNIFAQAVGIHAVVAYATVILQKINSGNAYIDLFSNMIISVILILASLLSARVIDTLSRRKMLLLGMSGMVTSLIIITWALHNMHKDDFMIIQVLFGCIFFIGSQGFSIGPIASLLPVEIFPQSLRGVGMGISIAAYWITNTIIVYAFPHLLEQYSANVAFIIFLFFTVIAWAWTYYNIPETSQVPLERLEKNLQSGLENRDLGLQDDMPEWEAASY